MNIKELEALRVKAAQHLLEEVNYRDALEAAAPDLFAAARRLEALEEAIWENLTLAPTWRKRLLERSDQILKERSK